MADEIKISAVTGLTISLQLYEGLLPIGSSFSSVEITSTGEYVASMPSNTPYGTYLILASVGSGIKIASGEIHWDGTYEVLESLAKIQGLDPNNPVITTQTTVDSGNLHVDITGDGVISTTLTRND